MHIAWAIMGCLLSLARLHCQTVMPYWKIDLQNLIDIYDKETTCEYRGEVYRVSPFSRYGACT